MQALQEPLLSEPSSRNPSYTSTETTWISLRRLTFSWLNPLLKLGYSRTLQQADVPELKGEDRAELVYAKLKLVLDSQGSQKKSLGVALAKCHHKAVLVTGCLALVRTLTVSSGPLFLYAFVNIVAHRSSELQSTIAETSGSRLRLYGFLLILALTIVKFVQSLAQRHWAFESRRLGARVRSSIVAAIHDKALNLSSKGSQRHSAGEVVSYIGVDAYRLGEFAWWLHYSWSNILQMVLALVIMFITVNYAALACVAVLVVTAFIQVPLSSALQSAQSKLMAAQDERLRRTTEVLNSIKIIKLQAWEEEFKRSLFRGREEELKWLRASQSSRCNIASLFWLCYASAVSLTLLAYVLLGNELNAAVIFTVFSAFGNTLEPIKIIPDLLATISQTLVSLQRLNIFINDDEFQEEAVVRSIQGSDLAVRVKSASFSWDTEAPHNTLTSIQLEIRKGEKVAVCGEIGSGKSSLLLAILGEIPKLEGSVELDGTVAYVSQTAWIQSGTVRDNILFGKCMEESRYNAALRACALDKDLEILPHGDSTEIGERGLNLSGGQKQRIQLARAVYNDAEVYLLDDAFSAVDAHTAATLFHECIMKALKQKTVVLVTHQMEFLPAFDSVVVMESGSVQQRGPYNELLLKGPALQKLVNAHRDALNTAALTTERVIDEHTAYKSIGRSPSHKRDQEPDLISLNAQLTEEEEKEVGSLGFRPYKDYLSISKGWTLFTIDLLLQVGLVAGQVAGALWLAVEVTKPHMDSLYVAIGYLVIAYATSVFLLSRVRVHYALARAASREFFSGFTESLFKAPMSFFDSTPTGRILSRAANDMSILDVDLVQAASMLVAFIFDFPGVIVVLGVVMWRALLLVVPVLLVVLQIESYYRRSAQELMRLTTMTKAPILNFSGETISGATTIRAFQAAQRFKKRNMALLNTDASMYVHMNAVMEWLVLRVETCGNVLLCLFGLFLAAMDNLNSGLAGVGLAFGLNINISLVILCQWYCQMASYIISVERIKQYMNLPEEPALIVPFKRPPLGWPTRGTIVVDNLKVRYRPNTPLVLRGITCTFQAGSKVGVVGRTGSGKSTLISTMFRLVEPVAGRILIDSIDICSIGLHDLRSRLGIIPQEPTLFRGTIRSNLDPVGRYSDQQIWEALDKCQMAKEIQHLESSVTDEGGNWSVGQRQLFCLGRVLLKRSRILMLDEATASIDSSTDAVIQRLLRQEFASCTVVTVAHRIPTVIDSDMVLVLQDGLLAECDSPAVLLRDKNSLFSKLVAEYWAQRSR